MIRVELSYLWLCFKQMLLLNNEGSTELHL